MRPSNAVKKNRAVAMEMQTPPKASERKRKFKENVTQAPCSLKQQCSESHENEDVNSEVLNICCSGFNSLLFLTPPKIRSTKDMPTPSPTKPDVQGADVDLETALTKELMLMLDNDFEDLEITPTGPARGNTCALQNITNRENEEVREEDGDSSGKKKGVKGQFKFPEGGWVCLACQNYNFCGRVRCNRCGKNKSKEDPVGKPRHLLKKENDENDPTATGPKAVKGKKQLRERAGDWLCLSCRNINFAFRQQCNRCKLNKDLIGSTIDSQSTPQAVEWNGVVNNCYPGGMAYCPQGVPFEYAHYAMMVQNQQLVYPPGM